LLATSRQRSRPHLSTHLTHPPLIIVPIHNLTFEKRCLLAHQSPDCASPVHGYNVLCNSTIARFGIHHTWWHISGPTRLCQLQTSPPCTRQGPENEVACK